MISPFGKKLLSFENSWKNVRLFAFRNRTIFEIFFISLYAGEQLTLIILSYIWPKHMRLFISLFALLVLSTFGFHKLVMESRIKILENKVRGLTFEKQRIIEEAEEAHKIHYKTSEQSNK